MFRNGNRIRRRSDRQRNTALGQGRNVDRIVPDSVPGNNAKPWSRVNHRLGDRLEPNHYAVGLWCKLDDVRLRGVMDNLVGNIFSPFQQAQSPLARKYRIPGYGASPPRLPCANGNARRAVSKWPRWDSSRIPQGGQACQASALRDAASCPGPAAGSSCVNTGIRKSDACARASSGEPRRFRGGIETISDDGLGILRVLRCAAFQRLGAVASQYSRI